MTFSVDWLDQVSDTWGFQSIQIGDLEVLGGGGALVLNGSAAAIGGGGFNGLIVVTEYA